MDRILIHQELSEPNRLQARDPEFDRLLSVRREALLADPEHDRYFPVLAVLAPVMTQAEGEITYPGDAMCLYGALSVAVDRAVADAGPLEKASHYNDLAPAWTAFPSKAYRLAATAELIRPSEPESNTDQTVFDPRVWDEHARISLIQLLRRRRPRVVLISAVSPAHRYALEIAGIVKAELPKAYVILGGRHVDETTKYTAGRLRTEPSSPLAVISAGQAPRVVDALVAGEAYFAVDLLMRALALSMGLLARWVDPELVARRLRELAEPVPGTALIVLVSATTVDAFPVRGPAIDLASLPSPYRGFAIRSRFPIFDDQRTAHFMVSNACPYHCNFCSETAQLAGGLRRFREDGVNAAVERVCEYVGYGAAALFFDDSVFWSGNLRDITEFCAALESVRRTDSADLPERFRRHLTDPGDVQRLRDLQWGAQLTVDTIAAVHRREKIKNALDAMARAGCTYVYIGLESMSADVMDGIHKNLHRQPDRTWAQKARAAMAIVKSCGIRVGTSVLFGLDGETRASIDETIEEVGRLIDNGLIDLASPNILTYHPATPITRMHGMAGKLDYHSPRVDNRKPYTYFEEAFPGVVSISLLEEDIWHIHRTTERRWGLVRNSAGPADLVP
jgi:radical SAM superfamily enzyme YgiQ (UPF0313 family)